jgi:glycerophosphoryl diester phosphodiesterase
MADPLVIAHRGYSSVAPENTLAAVQAAVQLDIQPSYIEIDLHRSSDGVLIVSHDENTFRTTGVAGMIRETLFKDLRKLDAGYAKNFGDKFKGEPLPRLEEVLDAVKDTSIGIMIESKQLLLEDDVVKLLQKRGEVKKHVFASFDELSVYRAKQLEPELRTLYLAGELSQGALLRGKDVKADILGVNSKTSIKMIQRAQKEGFIVWVWTVDDENDMKKFYEIPVNGLITNKPKLALELLNSK